MALLKTYVSPLLKTDRSAIEHTKKPIYWLDSLLEGGIYAPDSLGRPIIVLICGPPGAGKSLLLQQIAFCRSVAAVKECPADSAAWPRTVLLCTEVCSEAVAHNMRALGLHESTLGIKTQMARFLDCPYDPNQPIPVAQMPVSGSTDDIKHIPPVTVLGTSPAHQIWQYDELLDNIKGIWRNLGGPTHPDVLCIDSLNVLANRVERTKHRKRHRDGNQAENEEETEIEWQNREKLYASILELDRPPTYLFLVMDTPSTSSLLPTVSHQFWEYTSDVIIRLDYHHGTNDYFIRNIEVVKARFQAFALGRQLIKIFRDPQVRKTQSLAIDPEGPIPNIEHGGIFVFPSEHFVLSKIRAGVPLIDVPSNDKSHSPVTVNRNWHLSHPVPHGPKVTPEHPEIMYWPVKWCYEMVGAGVPRYQATALIGRRGLHKSYFGYQFLLDGVARREHVMVISFRDNISGVLSTLSTISEAPQYSDVDPSLLKQLVHIVYQRPGYVTPQELLHRVMSAVGEFRPTRAMINAVDEWHAGHPLLAESVILLPCLIDFLNTQKVTSMIVGVDAQQVSDSRGLTSKAEVVLSFEYHEMPWKREEFSGDTRTSDGAAIDGYPKDVPLRVPPTSASQPPMGLVVLRAVRVPHGAAGLARGVIGYEALPDGKPAGLILTPLAPEYTFR